MSGLQAVINAVRRVEERIAEDNKVGVEIMKLMEAVTAAK